MFGSSRKNEQPELDAAIARVSEEMVTYGPDAPEYSDLLSKFERLVRLKAEIRPKNVSPDALVNAGGSILSILVIVAYEQKHVMVSKALGFVQKLR